MLHLPTVAGLPRLALLGAFAFSPFASAEALIVEHGSASAHFSTVQSAIDAAAPGDTILVRAPQSVLQTYGGFTIDGKPLTIRGEGRPFVRTGVATVRNITLGDTVVLDGLDCNRRTIGSTVQPGSESSGPGLSVHSSQGTVRLVDCSFEGSRGERMWAGLQLLAAYDVTLHRCDVLGASSLNREEAGGSALQAVASRVSVYESTITGGGGADGDTTSPSYGTDGGIGLGLYARSVAWMGSSTVTGGRGGDGNCFIYTCDDFPGDGGTGLQVASGSICFESRCSLIGGPAGLAGSNSFNPDGDEGQASIGNYASDPETDVLCSVDSSRLRDGQPARLTVSGTPGHTARVAVARAGGFRFFGVGRGALQVSDFVGASAFAPLGVIPNSGSLVADVVLPQGLAADDSAAYFLQVAVDHGPSPADFRLSKPITVSVDGADVPSKFDRETVRVDASAAPGGDGRSWSTACSTLEAALSELPYDAGGEVWIREGTHRIANRDGVRVGPNIRLLGGFTGSESSSADADPTSHPTWLDGDFLGNGSAGGQVADNNGTLLHLGSVDLGLPVQGVEVRGIRFQHVVDVGSETGAVVVAGDALIEDCHFTQNRTRSIRHRAGDLSVRRSRFIDNHAARLGGIDSSGRYSQTSDATLEVESCLFSGNESFPGMTAFTAALLSRNITRVRVSESTFYSNLSAGRPGAMIILDVPEVEVSNCVFWANSSHPTVTEVATPPCRILNAPSLTVRFNLAPEWTAAYQGNGNVTGDPLFVDPLGPKGLAGDGDDDLRLGAGSPAIDAGHSLILRPWSLLDLVGAPRRADDPATPDTGLGGAPVVDMGAFER